MRVEDEYLDVLQNIEFAIVREYRKDKSVLDIDVRAAVETLARRYEAEAEGRGGPNRPMSERAQRVFNAMQATCEWRLGRGPAPDGGPPEEAPLAPSEIAVCLKRIRKSIDRWNSVHGRQGYLGFVSQYVI